MKTIKNLPLIIGFMIYFLGQFLKANIAIAFHILTPGTRVTPAIVAVPLRSKSDLEITLLSCLISLTPGTLALAIQSDPATMYVHGIFAPEPEEFRSNITDLEKRMLRAFRIKEEQ